LPEALGEAGFLFTIPEPYTPASGAVPSPHEVAPWVATIERLWDDPEFEARHRDRAREEAQRWDKDRVSEQYEAFLGSVAHGRSGEAGT
jgi:hypothetical protein